MSLSQTKSNTSFIYIIGANHLIAVAILCFLNLIFLVNNISTEGHNVAEDEVAKLLGTVRENIFSRYRSLGPEVKLHPLINYY